MIFFSALTLFVGAQEGYSACKKLDVGLSVGLSTTYSSSCYHTSIVLSFNKHRLTQVAGSHGNMAIKARERERDRDRDRDRDREL